MNYKLYFKFIQPAIILILIIILSVSTCSRQVKENKTERKEDKAIETKTARIDSLETLADRLTKEVDKHRVEDSIAKIASNRLIRYWKNKALTQRVKVDTIIQSNPDLKEFVGDQDSLISVIESRNAALEAEKGKQWGNFNRLLSIAEEQTKLEHEKGLIFEEQRDRYKKKADKKFTVGPSVGIDYSGKPTISISVQYRIFRF
jgi:hypothetical protein